jgi:BirA family biotin operon repressor/biotin-[acetyl-CoA-carboxylase] ligase
MNQPTPAFDLQRVRDETLVRAIDFHWELDSTNSEACRQLERPDPMTPLLVLTERQTQGRGRGQNRWWSAPGALTCTLVIPLGGIPGERLPHIALTTGLAICQAIEAFAPHADLGIKWPNDVYLDQRKLAGILIELPPRRPLYAVIGMGINVNNSFIDAPDELARTGISLRDALQIELDPTNLLIACLREFERRWEQLRGQSVDLVDQWRAYHILQDRTVEVDTYDGLVRGTCLGIDRDGALRVETPAGIQRCLGGVVVDFQRR